MKILGYKFKSKKDKILFTDLDLMLQIIFLDICKYCEVNDWPIPIITSTIRGKLSRSISDTHGEGRAIDFRSWTFTRMEIELLLAYVNEKYAEKFGTCPAGGIPRCLIFEDIGINSHLHLQVKRNYRL